MKQVIAAFGLLCLLAACGVDGAPVPPEPQPKPQSGVTIGGEGRIGVSTKL